MIQKCPDCGRTYDDVDHWTFCPHDYFEASPAAKRLLQEKAEAPIVIARVIKVGGEYVGDYLAGLSESGFTAALILLLKGYVDQQIKDAKFGESERETVECRIASQLHEASHIGAVPSLRTIRNI